MTWQEYFSVGTIVGLDENEVEISAPTHHIRVYRGAQDDPAVLNRIAEENAPNGFDIVIDDASHVGTVSRTAFWHIFEKHLKLGGIYVVEDWGTGYWPSWPDGAQYRGAMAFQNPVVRHLAATLAHIDTNFSAHNHGMVGFIKELVDECGRGDITHPQRGVPPHRNSRIERLCIRPGQVFATKPK